MDVDQNNSVQIGQTRPTTNQTNDSDDVYSNETEQGAS